MTEARFKLARGVGFGLRSELYRELRRTNRHVDFVEFVPENYVGHGGWRRAELEYARARWPLVAHGVSVSIGGPDPLDETYLIALKRVLDWIGAEYYSDHLCWTSAAGHHFHDLLPLPFTEEAVAHCVGRARRVSQILERPLVLENITYYATMPTSELSEGEFVSAVIRESDSYLLLDVNNAYLNAVNHGLPVLEALMSLPLERTRQIHLAGHEPDERGLLLDRHGSPVAEEVWALYGEALQRVGDVPVLIEWDNDIPALERVLEEVETARALRRIALKDAI